MLYSLWQDSLKACASARSAPRATAIAATARRLFAERGFDHVTVAEVAAAADVSEKTVFNHFATKEDLAFAGREEGIAMLVKAIAERAARYPRPRRLPRADADRDRRVRRRR